jgi:hypothetical protein
MVQRRRRKTYRSRSLFGHGLMGDVIGGVVAIQLVKSI